MYMEENPYLHRVWCWNSLIDCAVGEISGYEWGWFFSLYNVDYRRELCMLIEQDYAERITGRMEWS